MSFFTKKTWNLLLLTLLISTSTSLSYAATIIKDLRVEYMKNPVGIDVTHPRFSWKMESDKIGAYQEAYEIIVSTDEKGEAEIWSSGRIESDKSVHIPYGGTSLQPSTRYFWKVKVWNQDNEEIISTEKPYFETGLLDSGWSDAKWIKSSRDKTTLDDLNYMTDYAFEVDFEIVHAAIGVVFGYKDESNFFMWQINLENKPGKTLLRPHTWNGGNIACHEDKDISNDINIQKGVVYKLRIEVQGNVAKTYLNNILVDERNNPHGGDYGYGQVGFRLDTAMGDGDEEGFFDNAKVSSLDGSIVSLEEDFSDPSNFAFTYGQVENGRLRIKGYQAGPKSMQKIDDQEEISYDLELDMTIISDNISVIFSAKNKKSYFMWQINTKNNATPMLRRHLYTGGNPAVSEVNIGNHFTKNEILNKELRLKIEVRGKSIKTYLGGKLIDDFTNPENINVIPNIIWQINISILFTFLGIIGISDFIVFKFN